MARIPEQELRSLVEGYGCAPRFAEGSDPAAMQALMASTLDEIALEIDSIQRDARTGSTTERPRWPMIVLRTPKGWTGPKEVDGLPAEGSFRSHQVPLANLASNPQAFIHIIDSMFNQHAKWLKVTREIPWRASIASLNYLLSSHVWRQDHNGFSHQDPGFIDHVVNKKAEIVRVYLPPDANCVLSVADHCLRSRGYVNVIVAGKQPSLDYLTTDEAIAHCTRGLGIWDWASNDQGEDPDVVMACAGDIPTLETISAVALLREHLPQLRVRVVNVVDLMRLEPDSEHPHGLPDAEFDALFTTETPVIFAYHGYPSLIHRLTYRRRNHAGIHVRGYNEEGTTTTPFDMLILNDMDRFHLVTDVIDRVPGLGARASGLRQLMVDERLRHRAYTREVGDDPPDVRDWTWPDPPDAVPA